MVFCLLATGGPVTNETAGTKIVELSKKVREMTAELESEKNKSRQLARKCQDLQQQVCILIIVVCYFFLILLKKWYF